MKATVTDETMLREVIEGLSRSQKRLPSKYFYDERGSELFEKICELDEYYLTRTEMQIMQDNIDEITEVLGSGISLIELGSGSSSKTRLLLNHLTDIRSYIPVDISEAFLASVAGRLSRSYPEIPIQPVAADYTTSFKLPEQNNYDARNVAFFPGSTIGNFTLPRAAKFLKMIANITGEAGGLLIGVDLKKDREVLEAAYNDSRGVTAAFNKNILQHLNRTINANFNISLFKHKAIYNEAEGRIEMHLVSLERQQVQVGQMDFSFKEGETIHTENSYKYSLQEFEKFVEPYFQIKKVWTDEKELFSVWYMAAT